MAVIGPDGVLFGSSKARKALRSILVADHKLGAVVKNAIETRSAGKIQ